MIAPRLVRITLLTPANVGGEGGTAAVDRPVARDSWSGLPYLPESALKGVIAGRLVGAARSGPFGAPDEDGGAAGAAGEVVLGDGELLAFPVPGRSGAPITVFPAAALLRLARLGLLAAAPEEFVRVERRCQGTVPAAELPIGGLAVAPLDGAGVGPRQLAGLAGLRDLDRVVVAGLTAAARLWELAVATRTLTALGAGKRVRGGSLRRVELIPAGSVFVSLVTAPGKVPLPRLLQLGAWEGIGCGFARVEEAALAAGPGAAGRPAAEAARGRQEAGPGGDPAGERELLLSAFRSVRALAAQPEAGQARAILRRFGALWRRRGLVPTLGFLLAKAQPHRESVKGRTARAAYRWVLRELLGLADEELAAGVRAILAGAAPPPPDLAVRLLWLRRYAESLIEDEAEEEEGGDV